MSLSFCLHKWRVGYIREHAQALRAPFWFVWFSFGFFLWFILRKPQILCLHYLGASGGVGFLPSREVFFICLTVCVQGYPEHLELVCFSCLLVSQLGSLPPCVYLTEYQKAKDHSPLEWSSACRMNCDLSEPTDIHPVSPGESHFWCPWVGLKEVAWFQRSGLAALGYDGLWLSLKLPIWWFNKADKYLFLGWKCPHTCKGVHCWCQLNRSPTHCGLDTANASPVIS